MITRGALFLLLLAVSPLARAQTACPQGVTAGSALCGPTPSPTVYAPQEPAPAVGYVPLGEWKSAWGTIAMDESLGRVGAAAQMTSREEAETQAMHRCEKVKEAKCGIRVTYVNSCVALALAVEGGLSTTQVADDIGEAKTRALKQCTALNKAACEIFYAECSAPEFEPY